MVTSGRMEDGPILKWNVWIRSGFLQSYQAVEVSKAIWLACILLFSHFLLERKCGQTIPTPFQGMDITWPYKRRELGIHLQNPCQYYVYIYGISKVMKSFTPVQTIMKHGLKDIQVNLTYLITARAKLNWNSDQKVTCIWHRQSDTMMWWPQNLKDCNRESKKLLVSIIKQSMIKLWLREALKKINIF